MSKPKAKRVVDDKDREAGRNIKQLFEAAKNAGKLSSQEQFAAMLGVSQPFIGSIMNERTACPGEHLLRIADIFKVSTKAIRSDLPDYRPATAQESIDEELLARVWTDLVDSLKARGYSLEKIRPDKIAKLVTMLYKKAQNSNSVDENYISFGIELVM